MNWIVYKSIGFLQCDLEYPVGVEMQWDVFISHASEDKYTVARPLASLLSKAGLHVWLDEAELKLGDNLSSRISEHLNLDFDIRALHADVIAGNTPWGRRAQH